MLQGRNGMSESIEVQIRVAYFDKVSSPTGSLGRTEQYVPQNRLVALI